MTAPTVRTARRPGLLAALGAAVARARAVLPVALAFAPVYAVLVAGVVALSIVWREIGWTHRALVVLATFAAGGALAGVLAVPVAAFVAGHRPRSARFAAMFVALTGLTACAVLLIFLIDFRLLDADFWSDFPDPFWLVELAFTVATAAYTLTASGLPLLLPHGLLLLFGAAWWFARRPRG